VVPGSIDMVRLLGPGDDHLALIERSFELRLHVRGNRITLEGEQGEVALAERLLDELVTLIRSGQGITTETVERVLAMLRAETTERPADVLSLNILSNRGRSIRPKTLNQKRYVDSIDKHTITFGIGPGRHRQDLPGDGQGGTGAPGQAGQPDHPDPPGRRGRASGWASCRHAEREDRPLPAAAVRRAPRHDRPRRRIPSCWPPAPIEVAPLAYMRGRSVNDASSSSTRRQNTSPEQMKMFLTRLGFGSKIVVTGDVHPDRPARRA
jgi:phosphate starvation-inducible PhoH-like protein